MRALPVTKVGPTTVPYKFVANDYIRIQGSVVSWQDRRISHLAAAMATRTSTEQAGSWATPAGDRDRSRRPQDSARQRRATVHRQAAPAHSRPCDARHRRSLSQRRLVDLDQAPAFDLRCHALGQQTGA